MDALHVHRKDTRSRSFQVVNAGASFSADCFCKADILLDGPQSSMQSRSRGSNTAPELCRHCDRSYSRSIPRQRRRLDSELDRGEVFLTKAITRPGWNKNRNACVARKIQRTKRPCNLSWRDSHALRPDTQKERHESPLTRCCNESEKRQDWKSYSRRTTSG